MKKTKKTVTMTKKEFIKEHTMLVKKLKTHTKGKPANHPLKKEMRAQARELKKVRSK